MPLKIPFTKVENKSAARNSLTLKDLLISRPRGAVRRLDNTGMLTLRERSLDAFFNQRLRCFFKEKEFMLSARKLRRIAEHQARKQARKNGGVVTTPVVENPQPDTPKPEPPVATTVSMARLIANQRNAALSTGPLTPTTKSISAQNSVVHGLARHINGTFKVMANENLAAYETFKSSLLAEHSPQSETEYALVTEMAESHWLAQRAQRLQDTCVNPANGTIVDAKMFSLYMRYQTTHSRAFHKALSALQKLRSEKQKLERGFVAQKCLEDTQRIKNAQLEMKKAAHQHEVCAKEAKASNQIIKNRLEISAGDHQYPGFRTECEADLAKRSVLQQAA